MAVAAGAVATVRLPLTESLCPANFAHFVCFKKNTGKVSNTQSILEKTSPLAACRKILCLRWRDGEEWPPQVKEKRLTMNMVRNLDRHRRPYEEGRNLPESPQIILKILAHDVPEIISLGP